MIVADLVATLTLDDQMTPGLQKAGAAVDSFGQQSKSIDDAARDVGRGMTALGASMTAPFVAAGAAAADYSQALADVMAVGGKDAKRFSADLDDTIKKAAAGTRYNAVQAAGGVEELLKAGMSVQDVLGGGLSGTLDLASAGAIDVGRAAEISAQGLNVFGSALQYVTDRDGDGYISTLEKSAHMNDVLAQSAATSMTDISGLGDSFEDVGSTMSATGQDFETTTALLTAMSAFGTVGAEAGNALKSMTNGIVKNSDALEAVGVDVFDASGAYRDFIDIFEDLDKVTSGMSEGDRSAFLLDVFDSYGQKAAGNILDANDKLGKSLSEIEQDLLNPGAAAEMAMARMDSFPGRVEQMTGAIERLKLEVGQPLLDLMTPGVEKATDAIGALTDGFVDLPAPVRKAAVGLGAASGVLTTVGGAALMAFPALKQMGQSFQVLKSAPGIIGGIARGATMLLRFAGPVGLAAAAGLAAYETNFLGFGDAVNRMAGRIQQALPATQAALADFADEVQTRGSALMDAVSSGDWQAASDIAAGAVQGASTWLQEQANRGGALLGGINLQDIPVAIGSFALAAGITPESIAGKLGDLFAGLSDLWKLDASTISGLETAGTDLGGQIGSALVNGLVAGGGLKDAIVKDLPGALDNLGDLINQAMSGMAVDSTGSAMHGVNAMDSGEGNLLSGLGTALGGIKDGITAEFEKAFASGVLPTSSADWIITPLKEMASNAESALVGIFDPIARRLQEEALNLFRLLDSLPGADFSAQMAPLEESLFGGASADDVARSFGLTGANGGGAAAGDYQSLSGGLMDAANAAAEAMRARDTYNATVASATTQGEWQSELDLGNRPWENPGADTLAAEAAAKKAEAQRAADEWIAATAAAMEAKAAKAQYDAAVAGLTTTGAGESTLPRVVTPAPQQDPLVTALPNVGAGPQAAGMAGGDIAGQVQGMFAAANSAASTGISQLQATISSGMATLTSTATSALTSFATTVQTSMTTAFTSAATAAQSGMQSIVSAVQSGIATIQAAAAGAQAAGAAIGQGLVAGLQSQLGAVQAAASQLASAAQAGMQGVIQMGSPSRMAIPYGQSIGEGLGVGMEQKSPAVQAAAEKLGYAAEQGLAPLMDSMSTAGMAAGKALGVNMEEALATKVNGLEGWDPKSQIDYAALDAFKGAAVRMEKYGKRNGDEAAKMAGEAFNGLAENMSSVLMGNGELSVDAAHEALMAYRKLDADAKSKLPDDLKDQLKATYDEANITIGDVIKQRMGGRLGEGMDIKGRFKSAKENVLKGMLGMRTLEEKAQSAAEDGLGLAIDAVKQGLMSAAPSAEGAAQSAMKSALGSMGGPAGGAGGAGMGGATGSDPEGFAWALCECISGANKDMLGQLGMGNPAETGVAMLGHELSEQIAGTGDEFRSAMLQYADQNPALNLPKQFLGGEDTTSCMNICDKAADTMGQSAGQAAGSAAGAAMPAMPSGADFGKAAGGALQDGMAQQCVSLCGGTTDDMAQGVGGAVEDGLAQQAMKGVSLSSGGARELGKQLRSGIPGATAPGMPGATPDDMASGVADGLTSQCVSLCDDSGLSDAAGSLDSAAGGMSDLGGQIDSLTQSMIGSKFSETLSGIQKGLTGEGAGSGDVPDLIKQLNPNIERALSFDISQTNPHAAALMGGGSGGMNAGMLSQFGGGGASMLMGGSTPATGGIRGGKNYAALIAAHPDMAANPLVAFGSAMARAALNDKSQQQPQPQPTFNITLEMDGQAVGNAVVKTMAPKVSMAAQNMRKGSSMTTRA